MANILFVSTTLIFWHTVLIHFPNSIGWSVKEMYLFLGFVEVYFALKRGLFPSTGKIWRMIFTGQIDTYLSKPAHPTVLFILNNMKLEYIIPSIPMTIFLFWCARDLISIPSLLIGLFIVLFAVILTALLELSFSALSFWLGRIPAIDEIVDSFMELNRYPLTLLGYGWQLVLTIVFPFMFNATIPAMLAATTKSVTIFVILQGFCVLILWSFIINYIWKKGRQKYEGYGG
jgi:ABC-2 type transport system permease protein